MFPRDLAYSYTFVCQLFCPTRVMFVHVQAHLFSKLPAVIKSNVPIFQSSPRALHARYRVNVLFFSLPLLAQIENFLHAKIIFLT